MAVSDHTPNDVDDRRAFARIEQALSELGADHSPPAGWEARVLAASEPAPKPWWQRWQSWVIPGGSAAVAIAVVMLVVIPKLSSNDGAPQLALARTVTEDPCVKADGSTACMSSGGDCSLHQVSKLEATGSAPHRALRLYRERILIQSCDGSSTAACEVTKDLLHMPWKVDVQGHYVVVAISSNQPLPALSGELDADLAKLATPAIASQEKSFHCR